MLQHLATEIIFENDLVEVPGDGMTPKSSKVVGTYATITIRFFDEKERMVHVWELFQHEIRTELSPLTLRRHTICPPTEHDLAYAAKLSEATSLAVTIDGSLLR